jgi:hypothetical protein
MIFAVFSAYYERVGKGFGIFLATVQRSNSTPHHLLGIERDYTGDIIIDVVYHKFYF